MASKKAARDPGVAAKLVPPSGSSGEPREKKGFDQRAYLGVAAEVAQDTVYMSHTRWTNADKHFPHDPLLRTVDRYFPHAVGGPLHVDQPTTAQDVENCKRKAEAMKSEGLRYCYVPPSTDVEKAERDDDGRVVDGGEYEDVVDAMRAQLGESA